MPTAPYVSGTFADTSRSAQSWSGSGPYTASLEIPSGSPPPHFQTNYALFTNFGPSPNVPPYVPTNASAVTVRFKLNRSASGSATVKDDTVQPLHNGSDVGSNLADTVTAWPGSSGDATYDCTGYTPAQVNSGLLGLRVGATATGTTGQLASVTLAAAEIVSITWTVAFTDGGRPSGSDDGYGTDGGTFDNSGTTQRTGKTGGAKYATFSLFQNIDKSPGDTVAHAYLWAFDKGGAAIGVKIGIKNSVSPTAPASAAAAWTDVNSNLTATSVDWSISSSSPSVPYPIVQSPDLAAILTEYFAIGGFTSGASDLLIYVYGLAGTTDVHDFGTAEGEEAMYMTIELTSGAVYTIATGTVYQMLVAGMI